MKKRGDQMKTGKWKVFSNYIAGEMMYIVGRRLNMDEPLHSGNIEYFGGYTTNENEADRICRELNEKEE